MISPSETSALCLYPNLKMATITHDGSMVLLYMVTWIPSIYPSHVSIYTMDPMGKGMIPNIQSIIPAGFVT